jgi:hypothetical protein
MADYNEDERGAMRAYLQRAEVRLSTMHRIASAFLGGAGLLILFPVFFNEAIASILRALLESAVGGRASATSALLALPAAMSLFVPLYSLYLLLRDLVHFYFVGHSPGYPSNLFNPRFVLSGIAFSPDESAAVKREIHLHQYGTDLINFVLPFGEAQASYYDEVITSTRRQILPDDRAIEKLIRDGVLAPNDNASDVRVLAPDPVRRSRQDIDRFNAAVGLSGTRDRGLAAEVAKAEASLIRHATGLRRLLLRYMKALLMFIVTTLLSFLLLALADSGRANALIVLSAGYVVWAVLTPIVVRLPVAWIYKFGGDPRAESVVQRDSQLVEFERVVTSVAVISGVVALGAFLLALVAAGH